MEDLEFTRKYLSYWELTCLMHRYNNTIYNFSGAKLTEEDRELILTLRKEYNGALA
jgi:hypothetical protein